MKIQYFKDDMGKGTKYYSARKPLGSSFKNNDLQLLHLKYGLVIFLCPTDLLTDSLIYLRNPRLSDIFID